MSSHDLVPTVDLGPWWADDPQGKAAVAAALDDACRRVGFLQIVDHRIPDAVVGAMVDATDGFFALPLGQKLRSSPPRPEVNRGYAAIGSEGLAYSLGDHGTQAPPDLFEAFNIGDEHVPDDDPWYAAERQRLFAPNVWPDAPPSLRPALVEYFDAARAVALTLTDIFALALGLPERWFRPYVSRSTTTLRANHYERRPGSPPVAPGQMRMGAHTDYGIVTVLWADAVPGLQIIGPDGGWHDVVPAPGALLVNLGDLTATWTNDRWRSTLHRVVPPPSAADGSALRRSVALFFDGDYDAPIECLATCTDADNPPKYPPTTAGEHLMAKLLGPRTLTPSTATSTAGERLEGTG
jgi:isopenicillin N synthase-like dioxygenase